jgi:RHS repeat-associated protein
VAGRYAGRCHQAQDGRFDVFYIWTDNLGSPRQITDTTNVNRWEWANGDPFGNSAPNENPASAGVFTFNLRFPGQYFDAETGKHYNYFRDYDPAIGRYIQSDPLGLSAGLNTYGYVDASPLTGFDPKGLANSGPYPKPQPGQGRGTKDLCQYYDDQCARSGKCDPDRYACKARECCESFAENIWNQCTRKCLIDYDRTACSYFQGAQRSDCRRRAHIVCYASCGNIVEAWRGGLGRNPPPACVAAANALAGMGLW